MLSKRLARAAFMQGHGSNYRKLTPEEKQEAEKNFYNTLSKLKVSLPKVRNLASLFSDLVSHATIPIPKQVFSEYTLHNDKYVDNYKWMSEEVNCKTLSEYLTEEFTYTDAILGKLWRLGKELNKELHDRTPEPKFQVLEKAGFIYHQEQDQILRTAGEKIELVISREEILSHPVLQYNEDLLEFIKKQGLLVKNIGFSNDHRLVSVCFQTQLSNGLIVKDMEKGMTGFFVEDIDDFCVFDELGGLFYVVKDKETNKGRVVYRAEFSGVTKQEAQEGGNKVFQEKPVDDDQKILEETRIHVGKLSVVNSEKVFEEPDRMFSLEVSSTLSGEYILIKSDNLSYDPNRVSTEFRFRASNRSQGDFLIIQERKEGLNYDIKHQKDSFFLLVSSPELFNGQILKLDIPPYSSYNPPSQPPEIPETQELQHQFLGAKIHIAHNPQVYIEHVEAFKDHLVSILIDSETSLQHIQVDNFSNGTSDVVAYDKYEGQLKVANNKSYRIELDGASQDYDNKEFRYALSTLHSPEQFIAYNLDTRMNKVVDFKYTIPGVRIEDYISERIVLPANDGVMIPLTLVYNKRNVKSGDQASGIVYLYGGALEDSHNFQMDYSWLSMLDRGFLWVVPHIRGSHDLSRIWYERGAGVNKIRHFQDLLDMVVSLVSEKIVNSVSGYSVNPSGGLSLASLIVKEPELLSSVVMRNPLLDVFEYLENKRTSTEFGSLLDVNAYEAIRTYTPYQQRFPKEFGPTMITADYDHELAFQAMKFLAKSREQKNCASVIYKEYPTWTTDTVKRTEEFAFLIGHTRIRRK